jgi:hypothetical protein
MRNLLAFAETSRMHEDLANWQVRQQPHGKSHPEDNLVGQFASSLIDPASGVKGLANGLGWNNLFESSQLVQSPTSFTSRERHCP